MAVGSSCSCSVTSMREVALKPDHATKADPNNIDKYSSSSNSTTTTTRPCLWVAGRRVEMAERAGECADAPGPKRPSSGAPEAMSATVVTASGDEGGGPVGVGAEALMRVHARSLCMNNLVSSKV
jgi:hypothetical protein